MGYIDGESLATKLAAGPMEAKEAAALVVQISHAIQYAHERGVIHRDIKPSNILLDRRGVPRVTDFGLAKRVDDGTELTVTGQILGTPSYMPPEQAAGQIESVGPESDVYSLGAMLYAMVTGRPPFQAASSVETLRQVIDEEVIPPVQLDRTIPKDLETIILKCLDKSRPRRYSSAQLLREDLERFLDDRPILARPVTSIEKSWRWCRRNPIVAGLSTLVSVLVLGTATLSSIAYLREAALRKDLKESLTQETNAKEEAKKATAVAELASERAREETRRAEIEKSKADIARINESKQSAIVMEKSRELRRTLYLSDLKQISNRLSLGDNNRAVELLDRHVPSDGEEDLRSFEWFYLDRQLRSSHSSLVVGRPVEVLASSDDESLVAIGCTGGSAYVLDVAMRELKKVCFELGEDHWSEIKIVQTGGEHKLYCIGRSGNFRVWDIATSRLLMSKFRPTVLAGTASSTVESTLPDPSSQVLFEQQEKAQLNLRYPSAVSSSGSWFIATDPNLFSQSGCKSIALWDSKEWEAHPVPYLNDGQFVFKSKAISRRFVFPALSGMNFDDDEGSKTWEESELRKIARRVRFGYQDWNVNLPFADGTGSQEQSSVENWGSPVFALDFNKDESEFAAVFRDGTLAIWDITQVIDTFRWQSPLMKRVSVHEGIARDIEYSPDGKSILSVGDDGRWIVTNVASLSPTISGTCKTPLQWGKWLTDTSIAIASREGVIDVWDITNNKRQATHSFGKGQSNAILPLRKSGVLFVAGDGGIIEEWSQKRPSERTVPNVRHLLDLSLSRDGRFLAARSDIGWYYTDLEADAEYLSALPSPIKSGSGFLENGQQNNQYLHTHYFVPNQDHLFRMVGPTLQKLDLRERKTETTWNLPSHTGIDEIKSHFEWNLGATLPEKISTQQKTRLGTTMFADLSPNGDRFMFASPTDGSSLSIVIKSLQGEGSSSCVHVLNNVRWRPWPRFLDDRRVLLGRKDGDSKKQWVIWDLQDSTFRELATTRWEEALANDGVSIARDASSFCIVEPSGTHNSWHLHWFELSNFRRKAELPDLKGKFVAAFPTSSESLYVLARLMSQPNVLEEELSWLKWSPGDKTWNRICILEDASSADGSSFEWRKQSQKLYTVLSGDKTIACWNANDGSRGHPLSINTGPVKRIALDENGTAGAIVSSQGPASRMFGSMGYSVSVPFSSNRKSVFSDFSEYGDGKPFLSCLRNDLWISNRGLEIATEKTGKTLPLPIWGSRLIENSRNAFTVVSRDKKAIAQVTTSGRLDFWKDVSGSDPDPSQITFTLELSSQAPFGEIEDTIAISKDASRLAISTKSSVAWFDVARKKWALLAEKLSVSALAWSLDSKRLAIGCRDGKVLSFHCDSGDLVTLGTVQRGPIGSITWLTDGQTIASGGADGSIVIWDVNQREERIMIEAHDGPVNTMEVNDSGSILVSGGEDGFIKTFRGAITSTERSTFSLKIPETRASMELLVSEKQAREDHLRKWLAQSGVKIINQVFGVKQVDQQLGLYCDNTIRIESIDFPKERRIESEEIRLLSELQSLHSLSLSKCRVDSDAIAGLTNLSTVRKLDLTGIDLTNQSFRQFGVGSKLIELVLSDTKLDDNQIIALAELCPNIEILDVSGTAVTDKGLESVAKLKDLRTLRLDRTSITNAGLEQVTRLSKLGLLDLSFTSINGQDAIHKLKRLEHLSSLGLQGLILTAKGFSELVDGLDSETDSKESDASVAPKTKEVKLNQMHVRSLAKSWRKLNFLDLRKSDVKIEQIESFFHARPGVRLGVQLDLSDEPIDLQLLLQLGSWNGRSPIFIEHSTVAMKDAISMLRSGKKITGLPMRIPGATSDTSIDELSRFSRLDSIVLSDGATRKAQTQMIAKMPNVKKLIFVGGRIDGIENVSHIRECRIESCTVGIRDLKLLELLPVLDTLEFINCHNFSLSNLAAVNIKIKKLVIEGDISDQDLKKGLNALAKIEELHLIDVDITNGAIKDLKQLGSLRQLHFTNSKLNGKSLEELKSALPQTEVSVQSHK
jgi:serine/threonine protein kinase/Leucine-rich repeat (LRR) protein